MFQFPSNGKVFPNVEEEDTDSPEDASFNSLQTGRSFRTIRLIKLNLGGLICFNSLQTGRSFRTFSVRNRWHLPGIKFQFPSNGKVFPNFHLHRDVACVCSIRFQFPSNGKVFPNRLNNCGALMFRKSFNSLQTGRSFRTRSTLMKSIKEIQVSIPFKREGLSELEIRGQGKVRIGSLVSIPFKREGLSELRCL